MLITLDGGKNWIPCEEGIRVLIEGVEIDGEDNSGELVFNFTDEGLITDVWARENDDNDNLGTSSEMYSEIFSRLVGDR
jgi:hypothetical protein